MTDDATRLAKALYEALIDAAGERFGYVSNTEDLADVLIDGTFDLTAIAETLLQGWPKEPTP